jgi:diguanylate cyclase (GGDEF)-like protein
VADPDIDGYVVNSRDVSEQVLALERLEHQASHDVLTGLANRAHLDERLAEAHSAARRRGELVAALFVDIDHFKQVNDTLGHAAGDELLVAVAGRLRSTARLHDVIVRVGGDEFVILALVPSEREGHDLAERICGAFEPVFRVGGSDLVVTASVGLATSEQAELADVGVLEAADAALYAAKERGRHGWQAFHPVRTAAVGGDGAA